MDFETILKNLKAFIPESLSAALENFDPSTLTPFAALVNIKPETLTSLIRLFADFIFGKLSVNEVIPLLLPTFIEYLLSLSAPSATEKAQKENAAPSSGAAEKEVDFDIVGGENFTFLDAYLQSSIASE